MMNYEEEIKELENEIKDLSLKKARKEEQLKSSSKERARTLKGNPMKAIIVWKRRRKW